jgi:hypothetical protein
MVNLHLVGRRGRVALFLGAAAVLSSCGAVRSMAVKNVAASLASTGDTFSSDNDPALVAAALPFALKLHESLLAQVPNHEPLLTATCGAFTQYAFGFVQADAEALQFDDYEKSRPLNARALLLALRARSYCWRALEVRYPGMTARLQDAPVSALARATKAHVPLIYWSASSLAAAISIGGLDTPELLIDWPMVRAFAERALTLDETWNRGALHELMIAIESQGDALGGSEARARQHFARAVELQQGLSPGPYVSLAMGIAKARQDRGEFERLLKQALAVDPERDPGHRLVILLTQRRARLMLAHIDDLILQ